VRLGGYVSATRDTEDRAR